jgi:hypothetical protein
MQILRDEIANRRVQVFRRVAFVKGLINLTPQSRLKAVDAKLLLQRAKDRRVLEQLPDFGTRLEANFSVAHQLHNLQEQFDWVIHSFA